MFDLFAMLLSSIASFLFPIFASYKALKTSDPAQLTPWLMYWVVFSCCLLVESWASFILAWVPFYGYIRLLFFLYLILPQTQGARVIYEDKVHPFLQANEAEIDDFIASLHDRARAAGLAYFRQAIDWLRVNILGQPPSAETAPEPPAAAGPQSYTQSLLARFSVPAPRWSGAANTGADVYNLLAGAVSAAAGAAASSRSQGGGPAAPDQGTLVPPNLRDPRDKMTFIAAQRERLNLVLSALDSEAQALQRDDATRAQDRAARPRSYSLTVDGDGDDGDGEGEPTQRPPSGLSMWSALSKSRSEADFEKIEAESGAEDEHSGVRRRAVPAGGGGGSWMPWAWGAGGGGAGAATGTSSGAET